MPLYLTPLERQILGILDSTSQRWWTIADLHHELDDFDTSAIRSSLVVLRRNELVTRHLSAGGGDVLYAITTLGHANRLAGAAA